MEKRVLLAVLLSFLVLYAYQAIFPPPEPIRQEQPVVPPAEPEAPVARPAEPAPLPPVAETPPDAQPLVADAEERDIVVETEAVRAVFATRGAVLRSWRVKAYSGDDGQPLELVPARAPAGSARPFTLVAEDPALSDRLARALFRPDTDALALNGEGGTLTFEYRDAAGLDARKHFVFSPSQPYVIGFSAAVARDGQPVPVSVQWGPALGTGLTAGGFTYSPPPRPVLSTNGSVDRVSPQDSPVHEGVFRFAGVDDHYFLSAALGDGPVRIEYRPVSAPVPGTEQTAQFVDWRATFADGPVDTRFFFGPKDFDVLAAVDRDLVRAIEFGVFSWLVVPLLRALKWINGYVGNYGWSLILLTVLINLAMFPLRHKSVVSMRKMAELQPEMKAIQERYKNLKLNDPARQKMNVELMNLYRERGVNPASGCVPMLLTMPVLFAFYSMLSVAIEIRGAPFIGWIQDLSAHDPWFIWPVVMGATMVVQQRMMPTTADPMQQKMMMFMPVVFTFMFVWAPSGLVIYWTASNLWAIGQQAVTNRLIGPAPQRAARPPAERRVKNAGSGKSAQASGKPVQPTARPAQAKERK